MRSSSQLAEIEAQSLAPYAVTSASSQGRIFQEPQDTHRLPFQRDRDRIIHTKAFRRLKLKTQVFKAGSGDHYRDRLTHSMEVAQISRDVARTLGLNEDLAESIGLAHDLGHTPFGHSGEMALNEVMKSFGRSFEHNEQSKRVVEVLETKYPDFTGLNLTKEVIDGLMKHQSPYDNVNKVFRFLPSLEAQVVNIGDEIAYTNHDIDDGLRSEIFSMKDLEKFELWQQAMEAVKGRWGNNLDPVVMRDRMVSKLIDLMITDLCETTANSLKTNSISSLDDVRHFDGKLVHFSPRMREMINQLRGYLFKNLYFSSEVAGPMDKGQQIIKELFGRYFEDPALLPEKLQKDIHDEESKITIIKDYIAGMTDSFAEECFNSF